MSQLAEISTTRLSKEEEEALAQAVQALVSTPTQRPKPNKRPPEQTTKPAAIPTGENLVF